MRERRFKKIRRPRRVFLVVCEGETEAKYVEELRRYYRLPVTIKTKVSGNAVNERLVNQYLKDLNLEKGDDYSLFFIYDCDVSSVVEKLDSLAGVKVLSNPCFELWYILHSKEHCRMVSSDVVIKSLMTSHSVWNGYNKGSLSREQFDYLMSHCDEAITRAKKLQWPANPSSNIYAFIEALENEKKC